jgi:hypothetical protein
MPNPSTNPTGNITGNWVLSVTLSPAAVHANSASEQTFTVPGLNLGDFVDFGQPSAVPNGITFGNARVSAANTLAVQIGNVTAGTLTPSVATVYNVGVTRPDNVVNNVALLTQIT